MRYLTAGGIFNKLEADTDGETVVHNSYQDIEPTLNYAEALRNNEERHSKTEFKHYAEVPLIFVEKWMNEAGITSMGKELTELMFKKVNTEFQAFKVTNTYATFKE